MSICPESGFWIAANWPYIGKLTVALQFIDMMSTPNDFEVVVFLL